MNQQSTEREPLIFRKQFLNGQGEVIADLFFCQVFEQAIRYTNRSTWKVSEMVPWKNDPTRFQFAKPQPGGWGSSMSMAVLNAQDEGVHTVETWDFANVERVLDNGIKTYDLERGPDGQPTGRKVPSRVQFLVYKGENGEPQCRKISFAEACEYFGVQSGGQSTQDLVRAITR